MTDIKSPTLLYVKGFLFVVIGLLAAGTILLRMPTWEIAIMLVLTVWAFCRAYYFAFYVIEHYVDNEYKFAGLFSFLQYLLRKRK